jgi:hypothetical protein
MTTLKEHENSKWPIGQTFNNIGKTVAAKEFPDVVTVKKCFQTAHEGHDVLILEVKPHHTFIMPLKEAELIYQKQGHNQPTLF